MRGPTQASPSRSRQPPASLARITRRAAPRPTRTPSPLLAPGTLDLHHRVRQEWEHYASECDFAPYRDTGPTADEIVCFLESLAIALIGRRRSGTDDADPASANEDGSDGSDSDDGPSDPSTLPKVQKTTLLRRFNALVSIIKAEKDRCPRFELTLRQRKTVEGMVTQIADENHLGSAAVGRLRLGPEECRILIGRIMDKAFGPTGCMEQSLQHAFLITFLSAVGARAGSVAVSKGYDDVQAMTLRDVKLFHEDHRIWACFTVRWRKGNMRHQIQEQRHDLRTLDEPSNFDICPVRRLLALLFYRGVFKDFDTPEELFASGFKHITILKDRQKEPLIIKASKDGPRTILPRPVRPATAEACQVYFRRIATECGYPYTMTLHSARHGAFQRLIDAVGIAKAQAAIGHAHDSGVTLRSYDPKPRIDLCALYAGESPIPTKTLTRSQYGNAHRNAGVVPMRLSPEELAQPKAETRRGREELLRRKQEQARRAYLDRPRRRSTPEEVEEAEEEEEEEEEETESEANWTSQQWLERELSASRWSRPDYFACEACHRYSRGALSVYEKPILFQWDNLRDHAWERHRVFLSKQPLGHGPSGHFGKKERDSVKHSPSHERTTRATVRLRESRAMEVLEAEERLASDSESDGAPEEDEDDESDLVSDASVGSPYSYTMPSSPISKVIGKRPRTRSSHAASGEGASPDMPQFTPGSSAPSTPRTSKRSTPLSTPSETAGGHRPAKRPRLTPRGFVTKICSMLGAR